jgi:hypothetical protein
VAAVIRTKDVLLISFAVLWILFFLSPFAIYSRSTRTPMTRTERLVMIGLGLILLLLLWLSLPRN